MEEIKAHSGQEFSEIDNFTDQSKRTGFSRSQLINAVQF
jgi:hypothetical protein